MTRENVFHSKMTKVMTVGTKFVLVDNEVLLVYPNIQESESIVNQVPYTQGADGDIIVKIPPDIFTDEEKDELSKE